MNRQKLRKARSEEHRSTAGFLLCVAAGSEVVGTLSFGLGEKREADKGDEVTTHNRPVVLTRRKKMELMRRAKKKDRPLNFSEGDFEFEAIDPYSVNHLKQREISETGNEEPNSQISQETRKVEQSEENYESEKMAETDPNSNSNSTKRRRRKLETEDDVVNFLYDEFVLKPNEPSTNKWRGESVVKLYSMPVVAERLREVRRCAPDLKKRWPRPQVMMPGASLTPEEMDGWGRHFWMQRWRDFCLIGGKPSFGGVLSEISSKYHSTDIRERYLLQITNPSVHLPKTSKVESRIDNLRSKFISNHGAAIHRCPDPYSCYNSFNTKWTGRLGQDVERLDATAFYEFRMEKWLRQMESLAVRCQPPKLPNGRVLMQHTEIKNLFGDLGYDKRMLHCVKADWDSLPESERSHYRSSTLASLYDIDGWNPKTVFIYPLHSEDGSPFEDWTPTKSDTSGSLAVNPIALKRVGLEPSSGNGGYVRWKGTAPVFLDVPGFPLRHDVDRSFPQLELYQYREQDLVDDQDVYEAVKNRLITSDRLFRAVASGSNHVVRVLPRFYGSFVWKTGCLQVFEPTRPFQRSIGHKNRSLGTSTEAWLRYATNVFQLHRVTGCALNNIGWKTMGNNGQHCGSLKYLIPCGDTMSYPQAWSAGRLSDSNTTKQLQFTYQTGAHSDYSDLFLEAVRGAMRSGHPVPISRKDALETEYPMLWQSVFKDEMNSEFSDHRSCREVDYYGLIQILCGIVSRRDDEPTFFHETAVKELDTFTPSGVDPKLFSSLVRRIIRTRTERLRTATLLTMTEDQRLAWVELIGLLVFPTETNLTSRRDIFSVAGGATFGISCADETAAMERLFGSPQTIDIEANAANAIVEVAQRSREAILSPHSKSAIIDKLRLKLEAGEKSSEPGEKEIVNSILDRASVCVVDNESPVLISDWINLCIHINVKYDGREAFSPTSDLIKSQQ